MDAKARIAVLVSGGGTNLQALINAETSGLLISGRIALVISSDCRAYAIKRAEAAGIPAVAVNKKDFSSQSNFENKLLFILDEYRIDMIVLAGFLCILSESFTGKYQERIINVHPSLIPSFCGAGYYGLKVHEEVLKYGCKITGATVHYVNETPDGGKIISQKAVEVYEQDTPEMLQQRVMREAEWILLPRAAETVSALIMSSRREKMDNYGVNNLGDLLADNSYPGRGIIIGMSKNGKSAVSVYFIMGRSENSRNRVFEENAGALTIYPFDEEKVADPSLIIYSPVRSYNNNLIVTNGDQTDTIYDALYLGGTFEEALESRCFEPDEPNWTPRISCLITFENNYFSYKMSILKSVDAKGTGCLRQVFSYPPVPGLGHFIHTYACDGSPLPSFTGEPERVNVSDDIEEYADLIWNSLDAQNKVSLYVRYTDLNTRECKSRIINKHIK